jgi:hypothetical protein
MAVASLIRRFQMMDTLFEQLILACLNGFRIACDILVAWQPPLMLEGVALYGMQRLGIG